MVGLTFLMVFSLSVCVPPMVYVDCDNVTANVVGAGCQKSCQTLDMECVSTDSLYLVESILIKISLTITSYSWTLPAGKCFKICFLYGPYSTKLTVSLAVYVLMIKCWMAKVAVLLQKTVHVFTMGISTVQENQSELAVTTGKSILKNNILEIEQFKIYINNIISL